MYWSYVDMYNYSIVWNRQKSFTDFTEIPYSETLRRSSLCDGYKNDSEKTDFILEEKDITNHSQNTNLTKQT